MRPRKLLALLCLLALSPFWLAVAADAARTTPATAPAPVPAPTTAPTAAPLEVHFFFTPTCPLCEPAKKAVAAAEARFGARVRVHRHNHSESKQAFNAMILALEAYHREDTPTLALFAGDVCLDGDAIKEKLEPTLEALLARGAVTPDFARFGVKDAESPAAAATLEAATADAEAAKAAKAAVARRTSRLLTLIGAGLFDGFNPCAFATVILFVSMLAAAGRDRRTILAIGISFIVAVFVTYYALGVAFFKVMEILGASPTFRWVALAIKWIAFLMVLVAGVLSLVDFWRAFRSDGKEKMLMVLPDSLKDRIRKRLRATAHGGSLLVGAFVSGIVVSLLEAACTGQTYLPVITGLIGDNVTAARGYLLLLLYNVLFIIPLVAVFVMAFLGMTSEQIGNVARKKVWLTKLCLAVVFLAMAWWLGSLLVPTLPWFSR